MFTVVKCKVPKLLTIRNRAEIPLVNKFPAALLILTTALARETVTGGGAGTTTSPPRPELDFDKADEPPRDEIEEPMFAAIDFRVARHLGFEQQQ